MTNLKEQYHSLELENEKLKIIIIKQEEVIKKIRTILEESTIMKI